MKDILSYFWETDQAQWTKHITTWPESITSPQPTVVAIDNEIYSFGGCFGNRLYCTDAFKFNLGNFYTYLQIS